MALKRVDPDGVDHLHDPGVEAARERADGGTAMAPLHLTAAGGGVIRVGTAGWTDPTLTAAGVFYPDGATSAEARLRYYASRFRMVEVDSSYYALPSAANSARWAERTPADFMFNVKAHALMTGHPSETARLPRVLRQALPAETAARKRLYPRDLPATVYDAVWGGFVDAMQPLVKAGKLGWVLLQFPPWFAPGAANRQAILDARDRLEGLPCAVELRHGGWFDSDTAGRTLDMLAAADLPFVMVDEPQGLRSSVPPIVAATSTRLAVLRMHGRRADQWERRGASVAERYRYLYDNDQLAQWAEPVRRIAGQVRETHVVFNNCYANYGTTNALEMEALLAV